MILKKYIGTNSITLLLLLMILLGSSACMNSGQSSGSLKTGSKSTSSSEDTFDPNVLSSPAATGGIQQTQTVIPGITPIATAVGKIIPTPTTTIVGKASPTPNSHPPENIVITPTVQLLPTPTATAIVSNIAYSKVGAMPLSSANQGSWNFDISWIDQQSNRYYLADRTSKGIDIFDLNTRTFVSTINGFAGPNGVVADNQGQLWVGDADSTVKVVNLQSNKIIATISTGGKNVTDEIAYDPQDQLIIVGNGDDSIPFVTIISATGYSVKKKIEFPGAGGLEQPVWDPQSHLFYISVPKTTQNAGGEIDVIDPQIGNISNRVPLSNCNPNGFAIGPNHQAILGCDNSPVFIDLTSWTILAVINQVNGCDEVWYNPGDQRYYLAADGNNAGPVLSIVDAQTFQLIQNVPTKSGAHSVAVDTNMNIALVPIPGTGIAIYAAQ